MEAVKISVIDELIKIQAKRVKEVSNELNKMKINKLSWHGEISVKELHLSMVESRLEMLEYLKKHANELNEIY